MLKTSSVIHAAAAHSSRTIIFSLVGPRRRGDAIHALPSPIPRMKDMSTTANDWSDEPKIIASERDASTSSPREIPPVMATTAYARRSVPEATTSLAWVDAGSFAAAISIEPLRLSSPAVVPMKTLTSAVICRDDTSPRFWTSQKPARAEPTTAPRLFTE